jgi:hypothetical protein
MYRVTYIEVEATHTEHNIMQAFIYAITSYSVYTCI